MCAWVLFIVENVKVKLEIHVSVIEEVYRALVEFALLDPSTGFRHGIADFIKVEDRVRTKRRRATVKTGGKRKVFYCDSCNFSSRENYLLTRHIARIHDRTIDSKQCRFCKFSTIYSWNLKGHIERAHSNPSNQIVHSNMSNQFSDSSRCQVLIETLP